MSAALKTRKEWKIAVAALVITCVSPTASQIYWFGGWKSETDGNIKVLETRIVKMEAISEELPTTLQTLKHQQILTIQGVNSLLKAQGKNPIMLLPQVVTH